MSSGLPPRARPATTRPTCSGPCAARARTGSWRATDVDFVPDPEIVVSAAQEIALMEAERIRLGKFVG